MEEYENVGDDLFSRAASSQVSSAHVSLTSVFGMGTGGPSPLKSPTIFYLLVPNLCLLELYSFNFNPACVGIVLFSRAASSQVSSALVSLTSVFGMGTGGPSPLQIPTMVHLQGFEPGTH